MRENHQHVGAVCTTHFRVEDGCRSETWNGRRAISSSHLSETALALKVKTPCPGNPLSHSRQSFQPVFVQWLKDVTISQSCQRIKEIMPKKMIWEFQWKSLNRVQLLWPHGLYSPWNSPGQNTEVGSLSLLQGIFPTQGSNPGLSHCRWVLYHWVSREAL